MQKLSDLFHPRNREELAEIKEKLERIEFEQKEQRRLLRKILHALGHLHLEVTGFTIRQGDDMAITGITPGKTATFAATPTPAGSALPAGVVPTWTSDNSAVTLSASADGLSVIATADPSTQGTAFNLTVTATLPDGTTPSGTVSVPIAQPAAPEVTGFSIDQVA